FAPHPDPLPASGERESCGTVGEYPLDSLYARSAAFPLPACGERDRVRGCPPGIALREHGTMTWDILIRGGTVIDGSGRPGEIGDVAIEDGRIARLGPAVRGEAKRVIDAAGLAGPPGFSDRK